MGEPLPRAILIVDHGSRRAEANAQLDVLAEAVRQREPGMLVRVAHLEIAAPDIAAGLAECVRAGADEVTIHPFFLSPGRHTREDIPRIVEAAARAHPDVVVRISEALGPHPGLVDILLERVRAV